MENKNKKSLFAGCLLALMALGATAQAATVGTFRKQDSYTDPQARCSTDVDGGGVSYSLVPGNRFNVVIACGPFVHTLVFTGPDGALIEPGLYENTSPAAAVTGRASFDFSTGSSGCSSGPPGWFVVREFDFPTGPDGETHIAIDYLHRCGAFVDIRWPTNKFGSIRINSDIPVTDFAPFADGGPDIYLDEGEIVGLGAEHSYPGDAAITGFRYRQLSGPPVTIAPDGGVSFTAPTVPASGTKLSFELEVTNALGLIGTDIVDVYVDSLQGRRTFIELHGEIGNYLLSGADMLLKRYQDGYSFASILPGVSMTPGRVRVDYLPLNGGPGAGRNWSFMFDTPDGQSLELDNYEGAVGAGSPALPKINVSGNGRGCNVQSGRFVVLEFDWDAAIQNVRSLALDFEQHCENTPATLRGHIRINSAVAVVRSPPDAAAGSDANAEINAQVVLDGSNSLPGNGSVSSWNWRQVSGTAVTLSGANQSQASFTAPNVGASGETLVFELTVTNSLGLSDADQVNVFVRGSSQLRNYSRITGDSGEPITQGGTFEYTMAQDLVVPDGQHDRRFIDLRIPSAELWMLRFEAPSGRDFEVGRYDGLTSYGGATPTRAGVSLGGNGAGCTTADGSLRIFELSFDPQTSAVTRFAADFDVRCESFNGYAHVNVRYQSALPVPFNGILAAAGPDQRVQERDSVRLDGGRSVGPATPTYRWTQVSGAAVTLANANSAVASFDAPAVSGVPLLLEFELQVSDGAGHSTTDRVRVDVQDRSRAQTLVTLSSDAGDFVGRGDDLTLRPEEWNSQAEPGVLGNQLLLHFVGIERWDLWFSTGGTAPFQAGTYANATDASNGAPVLNVTGRGLSCTSSGSFTVRKVELSSAGALDALVLDFTRRCAGSTAEMRGTVVYRAALPDANSGADLSVNEGAAITLNGTQSVADGAQYRWTQTGGPAVTLTNSTSASASFTPPDVATDTVFTFQLEVTNAAQLKATDSVQVTVRAVSPPPPAGGGGSSGGGGGGGAMTTHWLALLAALVLWRRLPRGRWQGVTAR